MPVKHQNVALDYIGKRGSAINVGRRERVQYAREILQKEVWRHRIVHRIVSLDVVVIVFKCCDSNCLCLFMIWLLGHLFSFANALLPLLPLSHHTPYTPYHTSYTHTTHTLPHSHHTHTHTHTYTHTHLIGTPSRRNRRELRDQESFFHGLHCA